MIGSISIVLTKENLKLNNVNWLIYAQILFQILFSHILRRSVLCNPFHVNGSFLYAQKISENFWLSLVFWWLSHVFRGHWKTPVIWNGFKKRRKTDSVYFLNSFCSIYLVHKNYLFDLDMRLVSKVKGLFVSLCFFGNVPTKRAKVWNVSYFFWFLEFLKMNRKKISAGYLLLKP